MGMFDLAPKPKTVVVPAPAPQPATTDDAELRAEQQAAELRKRRGAASTVLTSQNGDTSKPATATATKQLLGS